ncbi:uncharacterized protein LOC135337418 isoform X1 [Halichondria panicea]|uniref:uncharacterized protein LOC135337418 isoform X1 n=2 Tax=Halichondria panicea TaxID=6063 RepID=UPI00312B7A41
MENSRTAKQSSGREIYMVGAGGEKGREGGEEKLYCQVTIEDKVTLFLDGPDKFPTGLKDNDDYKKFGYGYHLGGAPWIVGQVKGTVVAMETQPGILKESQISLIEEL